MEPTYTEWKPDVTAKNEFLTRYCQHCCEDSAKVMKRFYTNRDGETEAQYRVECELCKRTGKTYLHESVATISWNGLEHDPKADIYVPKKCRHFYIPYDE